MRIKETSCSSNSASTRYRSRKPLGLLILLGVLTAMQPCRAQEKFPDCQLTEFFNDAEGALWALEEMIIMLGAANLPNDQRRVIIEVDARDIFATDAKIRTDLDPNPKQAGLIDSDKVDTYTTYLRNINLFYQDLSVSFSNFELVWFKSGGRFSSTVSFRYTFDRTLEGIDVNGNPISDTAKRMAVFRVFRAGGTWEPRIVTLEKAGGGRADLAKSQKKVQAVKKGCEKEDGAYFAEQVLRHETARKDRQLQEEAWRTRVRELETSKQKDSEEIARLKREITALRRQVLTKRKTEERNTVAQKENEKRTRQKRLTNIARQQRKKRSRASGLTLNYQVALPMNTDFADLTAGYWHTVGAGLDFGYFKFNAGLGFPGEKWGGVLPADNPALPASQNVEADSLNFWYSDVQIGYPLYMGKGVVLYAGAGYHFSAIQFLNDRGNLEERFVNHAPLFETSLGWVGENSGIGVKLSYRRTFNAEYVDWQGLSFALDFKLNANK